MIIVNNYKNEIIVLQIYVLLIKISVAHPNKANIFLSQFETLAK